MGFLKLNCINTNNILENLELVVSSLLRLIPNLSLILNENINYK